MAFDVGETGGPNGNGDHTPESLQISWVLINPSTNTIAQVIPGTTMETEDPDKMGGLPIIPAVIESGTTRDLLTVASTFKATVPTGVYQLGMTWGLYNENIHSGSDIILDRIYFGQPLDTDSDGIPNHLDLDADNDGINDVIEGGGTDTDGDGQADGTVNGQGIPTSAGSGLTPPNSDTDSQPDYLDLDSDNDTISDLIEGGSGGTDANDDGMVDGPDADGDGIQNSVDGLPTFGDANSPALPDKDSGSDNDSAPDYTDLDDDVTGGAQDIDGTTNSALDTDNDGDVDSTDTGSQGDADGDGVDNAVDTDDANFGGIADASLSAVSLPVKLFLQGAYETTTDTMCDDLRTLTGANGFPQTSPYGGSETTTGAVLGNSDPNNAIVDWVNIELRDGGNNSSVVATVAALVQRDGDVVDASDGTSTLSLSGVTPGNYYLAVHHRNHLAAMTNSTVAVSGSTGTVDFTTMTDTQTHGSNAQVLLETGVYGLWGGNVNDNDTILRTGAGNDLDPLINTVLDDAGNVNDNTNYIVSGYYAGDLNMDGRVIAAGPNNDVTRVLSNIINHPANSGGNANHIVQEQLP